MKIVKLRALIIPAMAVFGLAGCVGYRQAPVAYAPPPVTPTSPPKLASDAPFGAVAYSPSTQKWQIVSDQPRRSVAQQRALSGCNSADCTIVSQFSRGQCASLSLDASRATTQPFVAVTPSSATAQPQAKYACYASGGLDCKASAPVCN